MSTLPNIIECIDAPLREEYMSGASVGEETMFNCIPYRCVAVFECAGTKDLVTRFERVVPLDPEVYAEGEPVRGRGHGL